MVSLIAPPELFSAYAFSVEDVEHDIRKGTHLRLYAGLGPSFPLTPFVVHSVFSSFSEPRRTHFTDRYGEYVPDPDLDKYGVLDVTLEHSDDNRRRVVRVDLDGTFDGAALLDQHGRVIGQRRKAPWLYSAPVLHKARVWGGSGGVSISTRRTDVDYVFEIRGSMPVATPGLPIEGPFPWYVGTEDRDAAMERVKRGAPRRLNPMDLPFGPFDRVGRRDERARVKKMLRAMQLGGGLEDLVERIVNDEERAPWRQRDLNELPVETGARQFARSYRLATLQTAAMDPGLARFLGFADHIDYLPDLSGREFPEDTLAIIGLFALSPRAYARYNVDFSPLLHNPAPQAGRLLEMLIDGLENASHRNLRDEILNLQARVREYDGLVAEPFVTFAAPVPPYLSPELPEPEVVQTRWQGTRGDAPSNLYRASFAFPNMPLVSMSALARDAGDGWVSRHDMLDVSGLQRATPGIFGHELEPNSRLNELNPMVKIQETAGLLSDQDIPADVGSVGFAFRASDFFGRFGKERVKYVEPPARPMPPPPILRFHIERAQIDLDSEAALSPGVMKLAIAVPQPWPDDRFTDDDRERLGAAIVVPRLDDLAPGGLALSILELEIGQATQALDISVVGITAIEMPLPPLDPQGTATWTLTGRFLDSDGNPSALAEVPVTVTDVRPPKVYPTGVGLFWTSAPGPSPEVELKLRWPANTGSKHRVYLTDQAGLGISDEELRQLSPDAPPSRGLVGAVGCQKVIDGDPVDKAGFRLLNDEPVVADADGEVVYDVRLPRSMQTVQFLRVVPLGPDGGEPPFENCGIVPIAVPESRRPPAPFLGGEVDPATGHARLRVSTEGFDLVALKRDEPGLFEPGEPGTEPPQVFVRRAVGAVADPIYARSLDPAAMGIAEAATGRFSATIPDTNGGHGLEPFVRYVYWAQVRLPPERRLPAGYTEINPTGGIGPIDPGARKSHKRPMSLPSAPRTLMYTPPTPPAAPESAQVETSRIPSPIDGVGLRIKLANPPKAHAKAVDQYRLAVWVQWPGGTIDPIDNAGGAALNGTWPTMGGEAVTTVVRAPAGVDPSGALTVRLGFVDPIGRMSDLLTVSIP